MLKIICGNFLMTSLLLIAACSAAPQPPQWLDQPQLQYPADRYLSAVASADDRQSASDRALSNLAKIFEVQVSETTLDFSSAQRRSEGEHAVVVNDTKVSRAITTETKQLMRGAQVVEFWQHPDGTVSALAILARQPAAAQLRQQILAADQQAADLVTYASSAADNPVAALNALKKARQTQVIRDRQNAQLQILGAGQGVVGRYDLAGIDRLVRGALATLPVRVVAEDPSVQAELQRGLALLGVKVVEHGRYTLTGFTDTAPVEQRQGWFWLRGAFELVFQDESRVLAKQRWPIKLSATDEAMVYQRAKDQINQQLPQYLFELLSSEPM